MPSKVLKLGSNFERVSVFSVLRRPIRAPGNDFLDTPQVHPCRLYAGIHAVEGPETRHPKLGSDLFVSLKDTLFRFGQ